MIIANETKYDYEFKENDKIVLKISKQTWNKIHIAGLDTPIIDGSATFIFSKVGNNIKIKKTINNNEFYTNLDSISWNYIKDWVRYPEKRNELTAEYKEKSEQNRKIKFEEEVKKQQESKKAWMDNSGFNSYMDAVRKYGNYHEQKQNVVIDVFNDNELPF